MEAHLIVHPTTLRNFNTRLQALLLRDSSDDQGRRPHYPDVNSDGTNTETTFDMTPARGVGTATNSRKHGGNPSFSDAEECLWLRVFAAVERYARPCRSEPRQGPTQPDLVPLETAVSAVYEIFGLESGDLKSAAAGTTKTTSAVDDAVQDWDEVAARKGEPRARACG